MFCQQKVRSTCPPTAMLGFFCVVFLVVFLLASCGGGGKSSGTTATMGISGTAATGSPIANSTVNIKCSNGNAGIITATTTSNNAGSYSASFAVNAAVMPCMVQVQITDNTGIVVDTLHGLANAVSSNGAATVNLTPLTEGVIATALAQENVAYYFDNLSVSQINALVGLDTTASWAAIQTELSAVGINHSAVTNPMTQVFSANGAGYDAVLDALSTAGYTTEHLYRMGRGLSIPPVTATGILNDTGIDWCTENITTPSTWVNNVVCGTFNWAAHLWAQQQDAFSGRDAQAAAGSLIKMGGGITGFDFTRMGSTGKPLTIQNATWSDTGTQVAGTKWDCVRDNTTGLMWEVKRNELVNGVKHLRHKDHRYSWYNPNSITNGGDLGYEAATQYFDFSIDNYVVVSGPTCSGVANTLKCNTQSYVTAVNAIGLCGFKDWRLPDVDELRTLTHLGRKNPAIDAEYFPNTQANYYWTSSPIAHYLDYAWFVGFNNGNVDLDGKYYGNFIRLVRSRQ